jgi:hypothetical protein
MVVMVSLYLLQLTRMVISLQCSDSDFQGCQVNDGTYKLNVAGQALLASSLVAKHLTDLWRTSSVDLGFAWTPKEGEIDWNSFLATLFKWYADHGVDLVRFVKWSHFDDLQAGRMCVASLLPGAVFARCYRHLLAAMKKVSLPGSDEKWRGLVMGCMQLSFQLPDRIFSMVSDAVLARLAANGQHRLILYVKDSVLFRNEARHWWDGEWRTPILLTRKDTIAGEKPAMAPGYGPCSVGQSRESQNDALKDTLPTNIRHADPTVASRHLQDSVQALAIYRSFVVVDAVEGPWVLQKQINGQSVLSAFPSRVCPRLVSGKDKVWTDHLVFEGGEQQKFPNVVQMSLYGNYQVTLFNQFDWDDVERVYTIPHHCPSMQVPRDIHDVLLQIYRASDIDESALLGAFRRAGIMRGPADFSISLFKTLFSNFVVVFVLRRPPGCFQGHVRAGCGCYAKVVAFRIIIDIILFCVLYCLFYYFVFLFGLISNIFEFRWVNAFMSYTSVTCLAIASSFFSI